MARAISLAASIAISVSATVLLHATIANAQVTGATTAADYIFTQYTLPSTNPFGGAALSEIWGAFLGDNGRVYTLHTGRVVRWENGVPNQELKSFNGGAGQFTTKLFGLTSVYNGCVFFYEEGTAVYRFKIADETITRMKACPAACSLGEYATMVVSNTGGQSMYLTNYNTADSDLHILSVFGNFATTGADTAFWSTFTVTGMKNVKGAVAYRASNNRENIVVFAYGAAPAVTTIDVGTRTATAIGFAGNTGMLASGDFQVGKLANAVGAYRVSSSSDIAFVGSSVGTFSGTLSWGSDLSQASFALTAASTAAPAASFIMHPRENTPTEVVGFTFGGQSIWVGLHVSLTTTTTTTPAPSTSTSTTPVPSTSTSTTPVPSTSTSTAFSTVAPTGSLDFNFTGNLSSFSGTRHSLYVSVPSGLVATALTVLWAVLG